MVYQERVERAKTVQQLLFAGKYDEVIAARVLRLARSAAYAGRMPIGDVRDAVINYISAQAEPISPAIEGRLQFINGYMKYLPLIMR